MNGTMHDDPLLERAYAHCARIIAEKARSFYFAARFLPADKRREVYALYAFCRTVDDIADIPEDSASVAAIRLRLDGWRDWLRAGAPSRDDPVRRALAHVVRTHDLPLSPLLELLDGLSDDVGPRHLPDLAALEHFCYSVAGTVGMVMAVLLGARDTRALGPARDLGIAMQLTNVLRDVGEDLSRGRIYLPADAMAHYGYRRSDLERGVIDERFATLLQCYIQKARAYYRKGLAGLPYLPHDSRLPIALAAHSYAGILTRIEGAGFDVFTQRLRTGRRDKLLLAARLGFNHLATRRFAPAARARHALGYIDYDLPG
jgi:15-cis-phytoene synthase